MWAVRRVQGKAGKQDSTVEWAVVGKRSAACGTQCWRFSNGAGGSIISWCKRERHEGKQGVGRTGTRGEKCTQTTQGTKFAQGEQRETMGDARQGETAG